MNQAGLVLLLFVAIIGGIAIAGFFTERPFDSTTSTPLPGAVGADRIVRPVTKVLIIVGLTFALFVWAYRRPYPGDPYLPRGL